MNRRKARMELDLPRQSADLAANNLWLNTLRHQAVEATILKLVDAQATLNQTRNGDRDLLAILQTQAHLAPRCRDTLGCEPIWRI
jgi:hypothetical protein